MRRPSAELVLLGITALWGMSFAFIRQGLAHSGTFAFLTLRFAISIVTLALIARRRVFNWRSNLAGLGLGSLSFVGFALQTGGLRWTTPSRSAFLTGLTVVVVPVVVAFIAKRPSVASIASLMIALLGIGAATWGGGALAPWMWAACMLAAIVALGVMPAIPGQVRIAIALAVAGLALMTRPIGVAAASTLKGDLLTLGCTVAFGFSILLYAHYAKGHEVFALSFGHITAMTVLSALALPFVGMRLEPCRELWVSLAFCGVVASAICIAGQTWAMQRLTATRCALIYATEPVFAVLFACAWAGDSLSAPEVLGGGCIVAATLVEPVLKAVRGGTAEALTS